MGGVREEGRVRGVEWEEGRSGRRDGVEWEEGGGEGGRSGVGGGEE